MAQNEDVFKKIVSHCKEYGFIYPSSEIYDGPQCGLWLRDLTDPELKNNIKTSWWKSIVQLNDNIVIDAAIFMHPKTWKASGHVDAFNDPLVDNKGLKKNVIVQTNLLRILSPLKVKGRKGDREGTSAVRRKFWWEIVSRDQSKGIRIFRKSKDL